MEILKSSVTASFLQKKAGSILDVFNSTITKLSSVIDSAKEQVKVKEEEIKAAQVEKEALEKVVSDNQAVVDKIQALLS